MVGAVSSLSMYYTAPNAARYTGRPQAGQAQEAQRAGGVWTARRAASPETPVEPVRPVPSVKGEEAKPSLARLPSLREGADPAEMAVRMRMTPYEEGQPEEALSPEGEAAGAESAQEALKDGECETCEKRKYQDGSDDMGVSFQTPTNIAPEQAAAAVRGHENEHVVREQAKARQEGRRVVSQSVTLHTDICPECGKPYISGGTTRTVTAAQAADKYAEAQKLGEEEEENPNFSAVA